mmetsp:Transcript_9912/g.31209  ORF Transcript_9912/g.31209 Transcript_9912/m.31209 type:complete len:244 (-) Transcript_9912:835-1566(-)
MLLYSSMVADTTPLPIACTSAGKLDARNAFRMVEKMRCIDSSCISVYVIVLKCRKKRGVTGFRPPPGGPHASTITESTTLRHVNVLRSYHPPAHNHCRSSSIGGCAPYTSTSGMFRSSTNTTACLPNGGPNTPLRRLRSLPSMMSCVWLALVCAEKLMNSGWYTSGSISCNSLLMVDTDLPVPVSPVSITDLCATSSWSTTHDMRTVSTVGTTIDSNLASDGIEYRGISDVHNTHRSDSTSYL